MKRIFCALALLSAFLAWPVAADANGVVARSAHCGPAAFSAPVYAPRVFSAPIRSYYSAPAAFVSPVCAAPIYTQPICAPLPVTGGDCYSAAAFVQPYAAYSAPVQFRASVYAGYGGVSAFTAPHAIGFGGGLAVVRREGPLERLFGRVGERRDVRAGVRASVRVGGAPVAVIRR
jgi:hypothetical protein